MRVQGQLGSPSLFPGSLPHATCLRLRRADRLLKYRKRLLWTEAWDTRVGNRESFVMLKSPTQCVNQALILILNTSKSESSFVKGVPLWGPALEKDNL